VAKPPERRDGRWAIAERICVVEIRNVGHAPTLLHPDQIAVVRDFLLQGGEPS